MLTISDSMVDPGHALGRVDGEADRLLGGLEVDDAPPFIPRERWWPMPMMRARCVRPRSESDSETGSRRATRHTTLLVPTSSTDSTALLRGDSGFRRGVRLGLRWLTWDSPWLVLAVP